jgi:hypothetical protein
MLDLRHCVSGVLTFSLMLPVNGVSAQASAFPSVPNGATVGSWKYSDVDGSHVLRLYKIETSVHAAQADNEVTGYALRAVDFLSTAEGWVENWRIADGVDCPGLDFEADFFVNHVSITDFNKDGRKEVTVPYRLFCGGGADPKTIKIITKSRSEKFALRGASRWVFSEGQAYGGEKVLDRGLELPGNADLKRHVLKVWQKIYIEKP